MVRYAIFVVAFLVAAGVLTFASVRFGLGRLPGDIIVDRGNVVLYLPITTSILVSLLLSLLLWLFSR
jgi:DUF2905 family protein